MTPEMICEIRSSVEAGEYTSTSEVMRDAVRLWQANLEKKPSIGGH